MTACTCVGKTIRAPVIQRKRSIAQCFLLLFSLVFLFFALCGCQYSQAAKSTKKTSNKHTGSSRLTGGAPTTASSWPRLGPESSWFRFLPMDKVRGLAVDPSGDAIVIGSSSKSSVDLVLKIDTLGTLKWRLNIPNSELLDVTTDSKGDIYLCGSFRGDLIVGGKRVTSNGGTDAFVLKMSTAGRHHWAYRFGGPGDDLASGVAVSLKSDVFVTGGFIPGRQRRIGAPDRPGRAAAPVKDLDVFVNKLSHSGKLIWQLTAGGVGKDVGRRVVVDSKGVVVAGMFNGELAIGTTSLKTGEHDGAFMAFVTDSGQFERTIGCTGSRSTYINALEENNGWIVAAGSALYRKVVCRSQGKTVSTRPTGSYYSFLLKSQRQPASSARIATLGGTGGFESLALEHDESSGMWHVAGWYRGLLKSARQRHSVSSHDIVGHSNTERNGFIVTLDSNDLLVDSVTVDGKPGLTKIVGLKVFGHQHEKKVVTFVGRGLGKIHFGKSYWRKNQWSVFIGRYLLR